MSTPPPLRNHIDMSSELEVKYWVKHLGVRREELKRAVDKVELGSHNPQRIRKQG